MRYRNRSLSVDFDQSFQKQRRMIFSIMLLIGIVAVGAILFNVFGGMQSIAEEKAVEYSRNVPGATSVSCNRYDTDANGYVTCTIFREQQIPMQIECGLAGCKLPQLQLLQD